MAKLAGMIPLSGSIGNISFYKMRGSDTIIARSCGGPSKEKIKNDPNFARVRQNNAEFGSRAVAARSFRAGIALVRHLADFNNGSLTKICGNIQYQDMVNVPGKRSIYFSRSAYQLESFRLNKYQFFENILRHPLQYSVDRQTGSATVELPELMPGINLLNPMKQPFYRFVCSLGALTDTIYDERLGKFRPEKDRLPVPEIAATGWTTWNKNSPAEKLELSIRNWQNEPGLSLLLCAGVEFGVPVGAGEVKYVKYSGVAKILKIG